MKIHILGICGTFMAGLALIAKQRGFEVTGSDLNVYPPMSDVLAGAGIDVISGYQEEGIPEGVDCVVIGNALSRGNASVEAVLERNLKYVSGPQWLLENVLYDKHVLAVSGTHGKTTTTSMLMWILEQAGLNPGFLVGGVVNGFADSARLTDSDYFVIEADEYDTAFFDKRSKFLHYHPRTLIMNNLEYDHADIFPDLAAIQKQFSYLLRTVPATGTVIYPKNCLALKEVVDAGCWSQQQKLGEQWSVELIEQDASRFSVGHGATKVELHWGQYGRHNAHNALAAIAAAYDVGVSIDDSIAALENFPGIKRRMELVGEINGIKIYDDFAHHPTAIKTTLEGLRAKVGKERIIAILQFGSNTMKAGVTAAAIPDALSAADAVIFLEPQDWSLENILKELPTVKSFPATEMIIKYIKGLVKPGDHVLVMSNKAFDGIHRQLLSL